MRVKQNNESCVGVFYRAPDLDFPTLSTFVEGGGAALVFVKVPYWPLLWPIISGWCSLMA
jgi:hypothetical protein